MLTLSAEGIRLTLTWLIGAAIVIGLAGLQPTVTMRIIVATLAAGIVLFGMWAEPAIDDIQRGLPAGTWWRQTR